ncbi:MAG: nitroreductase family protein [Sphaerochaetaceae bacterium]
MNEVMRSLLSRRSVRSYMEKQVPLDKVLMVVEAGRYAPNGMHQEPWHFTVLRNAEKLEQLNKLVLGENASGSFFYNAPTLILVSIEIGNAFAQADSACAMTNMMNAAHSLGLASVWCNRINGNSSIDTKLTAFGVPQGYQVTATLALGYGAAAPSSEWKIKENTVTVVE